MITYNDTITPPPPPLSAEGAMCTFHTFEKNAFKDLQPPKNSGLQYKCLMLVLSIVYDGKVSSETSFKQFCLEIKSKFPLLEITLFAVWQILNSLGLKSCMCQIASFVTKGCSISSNDNIYITSLHWHCYICQCHHDLLSCHLKYSKSTIVSYRRNGVFQELCDSLQVH